MEEQISYKEQYHIGLKLLKKDIEELKNNSTYSSITNYFEYPISLLEATVSATAAAGNDTEEFYQDKCEEILDIYKRLTITTYIVSKEEQTLSAKIRRLFKKKEGNKNGR